MLTFLGKEVRHCDGLSRRGFLKAGMLGLGGLTLADLLRAEQTAGIGASSKAIINIHLDGGPPQMDMIDPKPDAPAEYRGTFSSLRTVIPGFHVTEIMPQTARIADKLVFIRSLVGADNKHDAFQCQSGFTASDLSAVGGRPAMGCIVNKLLARPGDAAPVFADLMQGRALVRDSARPGFLGHAYRAFRPDISGMFKRTLEDGMKIQLKQLGAGGHTTALSLTDSMTLARLEDRASLLRNMDRLRRDIDRSGAMEALDVFNQQAIGILTSGKLAEAMDLSREKPSVVERYTPRLTRTHEVSYTSEDPNAAHKLLLARRLIEAGVRCVSVSISDFDTHGENFKRMKYLGPLFDHALHALVTDLEERGMLDDVTILAWGEFGRTPKVNAKAGRDHWPRVAMAMLAGGGMPTGQVIGATDRYAGEATDRPVHYQDLIATLYHKLGINPRTTTVQDTTGRPQYLVEHGEPVRELL